METGPLLSRGRYCTIGNFTHMRGRICFELEKPGWFESRPGLRDDGCLLARGGQKSYGSGWASEEKRYRTRPHHMPPYTQCHSRPSTKSPHHGHTHTHKYRLIAEILIVHLLRRLPCPTGKLHWVGIYLACSKLVFNLQAYVAALQAHRRTNSIDQKRWRHIQR